MKRFFAVLCICAMLFQLVSVPHVHAEDVQPYCEFCGEVPVNPYYTENGEGHDQFCEHGICYATQQEHQWAEGSFSATEEMHHHYCSLCNAIDSGEEHSWNETSYNIYDEGHQQYCTVCQIGNEMEPHTFGDRYISNPGDWQHGIPCLSCGYVDPTTYEPCVESDDYTITPYTHDTHCSICNTRLYSSYHSWQTAYENEQGESVHDCEQCGYTALVVLPENCDHSVLEDGYNYNSETHSQFCMICQRNVREENHQFNPTLQADSNGHSRFCEVCQIGIDYEFHNMSAPYVNAMGETVVSCEICAYETQFADPQTCEHSWIGPVFDQDTHWNTCSLCWTKDTAYAHTWSKDLSCDDNVHYHACTVCNAKNETESHVWNEDSYSQYGEEGHASMCSVCHFTAPIIPHTISETIIQYENSWQHGYCCTVCGWADYETLEDCTLSSDYRNDPYRHFTYCTVCEGALSTENHFWDTPYENEQSESVHDCVTCGYTALVVLPENCDHSVLETGYSYNDNFHYQFCLICQANVNEEPHDILSDLQFDTGSHYLKCRVCEGFLEIKNHRLSRTYENENGEMMQVCDLCGCEKPVVDQNSCEHCWNSIEFDQDNHWQYCTECWLKGETYPHSWSDGYSVSDEGHNKYCTVCSAKAAVQEHTWNENDYRADENGHCQYCTVCGGQSARVAHTYSDVPVQNQYGWSHGYSCTTCGWAEPTTLEDCVISEDYIIESYVHKKYCTVCNGILSRSFHSWGDAYENEQGESVHDCTDCGYSALVVLPKDCDHSVLETGYFYNDNFHYQFCLICQTNVNEEAHDFFSDFRYDNSYHYLECKVCEGFLEMKNHRLSRTYENENGEMMQVCDLCGCEKPVVDQNSCEHCWNSIEFDQDNHWQYCTECWIKGETYPHSWSDDYSGSDEGHNKYCTVCSAKAAVQEHTWNENDYRADESGHCQYCTVCGGQSARVAHTYSDVPVQNQYGWSHGYSCTVCSYVDQSSIEDCTFSSDYRNDPYRHYYYCTVCEGALSTENHFWDTPYENEQSESVHDCVTCGYTALVVLPENCDHSVLETGYFYNNNFHYQFCLICQSNVNEEAHDILSDLQFDTGSHYLKCRVCEGFLEMKNHRLSRTYENENGEMMQVCDLCGCEKPVVDQNSCEHCWNSIEFDQDNHWQYCTECWIKGETYPHSWSDDYSVSDEGHNKYCTICSAKAAVQEHTWNENDYRADESGHCQYCNVCGGQSARVAHTFSDVPVQNQYSWSHGYSCTTCGWAEPTTLEDCVISEDYIIESYVHKKYCTVCNGILSRSFHSWGDAYENEQGESVHDCTDCGYSALVVLPKDCDHSVLETGYFYNNNFHYQFCLICQSNVNEEAHDILSDFRYDNSNHYLKCRVCEGFLEMKNHRLSRTYENENGEMMQVCDLCGCEKPVVDQNSCEHCWNSIEFDQDNHWQYCTECWIKGETYPHSWSDGYSVSDEGHNKYCTVCSAKAAVQEHTWNENDYRADENGHCQYCTVCGGQSAQVAHTFSDTPEQNEYGWSHGYSCTICSYVDQSSIEDCTLSSDYRNDPYRHFTYCTVCEGALSTEIHCWNPPYENEQSESVHDCVTCGYTALVVLPENCDHSVLETGYMYNNNYHYQFCLICQSNLNEEAHDILSDLQFDTGSHYLKCRVCEGYLEMKNHRLSRTYENENGEMMQVCDLCGCEKPVVDQNSCEHCWNSIEFDQDNHWQYCTECWIKGETEEHLYGTSWYVDGDAGHYRICIYCNTYSAVEPHIWSGNYECYNDGHSNICSICFAYEPKQPHNWSDTVRPLPDLPSVSHSFYCLDCGMAQTSQLHTIQTRYDDYYHYEYCDACGWEKKSMHERNHISDINGSKTYSCYTCGYTGKYTEAYDLCDHVWHDEYVFGGGNAGHCTICVKCLVYSEPQAHVWEEKYIFDTNTHWKKCTICGNTSNFEGHSLDKTINGIGYCKCGASDTSSAECDHSWNWDTYIQVEGGHAHPCLNCWAVSDAVPHEWADNSINLGLDVGHVKACSTCGAISDEVEDHVWSGWMQLDNSHAHRCTKCDVYDTAIAHTWSEKPISNGYYHHSIKCTICGKEDSSTLGDHDTSYEEPDDYDEYYHYFICSICDYEKEKSAHEWDMAFENEDGKMAHTCLVCGYTALVQDSASCQHEWSTASSGNIQYSPEGHSRYCIKCCTWEEVQPHILGDAKPFCDWTHVIQCEVCNYIEKREGHVGGGDIIVDIYNNHQWHCVECGELIFANPAETCEHQWNSFWIVSEEGHSHYCTICCATGETQPHEFVDGMIDYNGFQHWEMCIHCGYGKNVEDHDPTNNYFIADDCHIPNCNICGVQMNRQPHTWGTELQPKDNGHAILCQVCGGTKPGTYANHSNNDIYAYDEYHHSAVCVHCNERYINNYHNWEYYTNDEGVQMQRCYLCLYEMPKADPATCPHTQIITGFFNYGTSGHADRCIICEAAVNLRNHTLPDTYKKGPQYHYAICPDCNYHFPDEPHSDITYGTNPYGDTTATCGVCGYASIVTHPDNCEEHLWTRYFYPVDGGHVQVCMNCWTQTDVQPHEEGDYYSATPSTHYKRCIHCDAELSHAAHDMTGYEFNYSWHFIICNDCGYTDGVEHDHIWSSGYSQYNDGHVATCVCGSRNMSAIMEHRPADEYYITAYTHSIWCKDCSFSLSTEDHIWGESTDDAGHTIMCCTVCGYEKPEEEWAECEHEWYDYGYSITPEGHGKLCALCNKREMEAHEFWDDNYISLMGYHYRPCMVCGYEEYSPHSFDEMYENEDGSVSIYCNVCWYDTWLEFGLEECDHEWTLKYTPGENGHISYCTKCWQASDEVPHIWSKGYLKTDDGHYHYCIACEAYSAVENHIHDSENPGHCICGAEMDDPATELKILEQPTDVTVPEGENASTTVVAQGDGLSYQWYYANAGSSKFNKASITTAAYSVEMNESRNGRRIYCVVTDQYGNTIQSDTVTISMEIPVTELKILTQPTDASAFEGETVSTFVEAQGDGLTYQWYHANPGSSNFLKGSVTSNVYTVEMTESRNGRRVYCVVKDQYGNTVTSDTVTLTMEVPVTELKILTQPTDVSALEGETVSTFVEAQGDGLTYQWYYANAGAATFSKASITAAVYSVEMNESRNGRRIYCVVKDQYGNTVTSDTVTLTMEVPVTELKILTQPTDASALEGETVSTSVETQGDGLIYQWYHANPGSSNFLKGSVTSNVYTVEMTESRNGRRVYCVVKDQYGNTVTSDTVTLTMEVPVTELKILTQPTDVSALEGETVSTFVEAQGDGLTYQWYYANAGSATFSKASITTAVYSVEMNESRNGRRIYCVVTDQYGSTVTSNTVTITMKMPETELKILIQPENVSVYEGETASTFVEVQGDGLTYQWYSANAGSSRFTKSSITSAVYAVEMNATRAGRRIYCVVTDQYGNTVQSNTVTLIMKEPVAELKILKQPENISVYEGEMASTSVEAQGDGLTYQWYSANAGSSRFTKASITSAVYAVEMNATRAGRRIYCVVKDQYGNAVTSDTVTLTMKEPVTELKILKQPVSVSVAEGEMASASVEAQGDGLTYQWYFANAGSSKFSKASITAAVYSVEMNTTRSGRRIYCVVTDKHGNTVQSDTITLQMMLPPTELKIIRQPVNVSVTEGEMASTSVEAQGDGLTYQWYSANAGSSKFGKASITSAVYAVEMNATRSGRRIYCVVKDQYGNTVQSDIVTLLMKEPVTELKITRQPSNITAVAGETVSTGIAAEGDGLTYQWYYANAGSSTFRKGSVTGPTYTVEMDSSRAGRRIYCVVTDQYGNTVQSNTVTLTLAE